jgi:hypothetical protein
LGALEVRLLEKELAQIDEILPLGIAAGTGYPEAALRAVNL